MIKKAQILSSDTTELEPVSQEASASRNPTTERNS